MYKGDSSLMVWVVGDLEELEFESEGDEVLCIDIKLWNLKYVLNYLKNLWYLNVLKCLFIVLDGDKKFILVNVVYIWVFMILF